MPASDLKITALTAIGANPVNPATFPMPMVDTLDNSIASATITGDLTVRTTKLAVTSTGVGCGTATPANQLSVRNEGASGISVVDIRGGTGGAGSLQISGNGTTLGTTSFDFIQNSAGAFILNRDATPLAFYVNGGLRYEIGTTGISTWSVGGTTAMTLNSTGLGVGVTPSAWNSDFRALQVSSSGSYLTSYISGATINQWLFIGNNAFYDTVDSRWEYIRSKPSAQYIQYNNEHQWLRDTGTQTAGAACSFTQAMTLDAVGNLLVGQTTQSVATVGASLNFGGEIVGCVNGSAVLFVNRLTSDGTIVDIRRSGVTVGTIAVTTTATTYNTSSDYRLKESAQPLVGGLARVNALKPSVYKWKANGSAGEGFLAHELAEVVPLAVTGDKDAVDADGEPTYQGVDLSKLVPILVAAIQELTARVQTLEAR